MNTRRIKTMTPKVDAWKLEDWIEAKIASEREVADSKRRKGDYIGATANLQAVSVLTEVKQHIFWEGVASGSKTVRHSREVMDEIVNKGA
jgi:hypothetical protein